MTLDGFLEHFFTLVQQGIKAFNQHVREPFIQHLPDFETEVNTELPSNAKRSLNAAVIIAWISIVLHVLNYNLTAQLAYYCGARRIWRPLATVLVYLYALYLIVSALVRDHYIDIVINLDRGSLGTELIEPLVDLIYEIIFLTRLINHLPISSTVLISYIMHILYQMGLILVFLGVLLNLWTLWALGIKGMYNGDSFGFLMDNVVTNGPFVLFKDPQYVGTSIFFIGYGLINQSLQGIILGIWIYIIFNLSAKFIEGPHLRKLYFNKNKNNNKNKNHNKNNSSYRKTLN